MRKHKNGWMIDIRHGGGRIRKVLPSAAEAEAWEKVARDRLARGLPAEDVMTAPTVMSLQQAADATAKRWWTGTANEDDAVRNAQAVVDFLGPNRPVGSISEADLDRLVIHLRDTKLNSSATINRKLAALSKVLSYMVRQGIITKAPSVKKERETEGRIRFYTPAEEEMILQWCKKNNPRLRDLVVFLADTGCRLGEACRLQWRDVDGTYVRFSERKGGKNSSVPLSERLKIQLAARGKDTELVFPGWTRQTVNTAWKPCRKAVGLKADPQAVVHTWRHTCASRLVQANVPIQVVQQWLGHARIQITLKYAHLAPANLLSAVEAINAVKMPVAVAA